MKIVKLYIKIHNITGLKYFGRTIHDPFKYRGSGTYWTNHLKKYGNDVTTKVLFAMEENHPRLIAFAIWFSEEFNIVKSNKWANQIVETSLQYPSLSGKDAWNYGKPLSEETKKKISLGNMGDKNGMFGTDRSGSNSKWYGQKHTEESKEKMRKPKTFKNGINPLVGTSLSDKTKEKISIANSGKRRTEEWKRERSIYYSGNGNPNYGKYGINNHNYGKIIIHYNMITKNVKENELIWYLSDG